MADDQPVNDATGTAPTGTADPEITGKGDLTQLSRLGAISPELLDLLNEMQDDSVKVSDNQPQQASPPSQADSEPQPE
tara:strand:- start:57 stop:290 length:234 start_codon:yes stop_codon:yes gene_type:complete